MRTLTAGQRIARGAGTLRAWTRSLVNRARIATKDRADARDRLTASIATPTLRERHDDLVRFYQHYEALVETLCDAAQYGPTDKLEASYAEHRKGVGAYYASVRSYAAAYLRFTPEDAKQSMQHNGRCLDAFDALIAPSTLREFLETDDGHMISRINRTREALNLYGEHLRQLLTRG